MDEILKCGHWNKSCLITSLFFPGKVYQHAVQAAFSLFRKGCKAVKTVLQHFQFLISLTVLLSSNSKARNWNTYKLDSDFSTYLSYWVQIFHFTLKSLFLDESPKRYHGNKNCFLGSLTKRCCTVPRSYLMTFSKCMGNRLFELVWHKAKKESNIIHWKLVKRCQFWFCQKLIYDVRSYG